jgi:carbon monoxide dehydrogenase subunit G
LEISGEYRFDADRSSVWATFMSPGALREAIPGCQGFQETSSGTYKVVVRVSIAAITGVYNGVVAVQDPIPMESYKMSVDGNGKAGRVQAIAEMTFVDHEGGTLVRYRADIKPQGAIARLGNRLISSAANLLIGQFFKGMEGLVKAS